MDSRITFTVMIDKDKQCFCHLYYLTFICFDRWNGGDTAHAVCLLDEAQLIIRSWGETPDWDECVRQKRLRAAVLGQLWTSDLLGCFWSDLISSQSVALIIISSSVSLSSRRPFWWRKEGCDRTIKCLCWLAVLWIWMTSARREEELWESQSNELLLFLKVVVESSPGIPEKDWERDTWTNKFNVFLKSKTFWEQQ